ncbi:hypothetical protein TNCV_1342551 [Trichonephila clavipes]|nr:hypothetical protein TNCV_1342551 [Trichonephila clavipes]
MASVVSRRLEHYTENSVLAPFHLNFDREHLGGSGMRGFTFLPFLPNSGEDSRLSEYLKNTHTKHLQVPMPSSDFKPRSYGRTVSLTNNYTVWAAPNSS